MKKYKVFDVVELINGNKAIIKEVIDYKTFVVYLISKEGRSLGIKIINKNEIVNTVFKKK